MMRINKMPEIVLSELDIDPKTGNLNYHSKELKVENLKNTLNRNSETIKMARPIKSGLDYFTHDTDAAGDEKVESLMLAHGPKGYTFYFILLERIYRTDNGELRITAAETMPLLCRKMYITLDEFQNILKTAVDVGCFDKQRYEQESVLTSDGIKKRYENVMRNRLRKRTNTNIPDETDGYSEVSPGETTELGGESKVKESKVKESKVKDTIPFAEIIEHLNTKAKTAYNPKTKITQKHIRARWSEGRTLDDFKSVIDNMTAAWISDVKMVNFLRPETLFGNKFESYLNWKKGAQHAGLQNGSSGRIESTRERQIRQSKEDEQRILRERAEHITGRIGIGYSSKPDR